MTVPMKVFSRSAMQDYLANDWVAGILGNLADQNLPTFTSDDWLKYDSAKRCIYDALYGDLCQSKPLQSIADIGGGLSSCTWSLFKDHNYTVVDLCNHETELRVYEFQKSCPETKLIPTDWQSFEIPQKYDLVIANDLFPNVDQRLDEFLDKFIPFSKEIRLSLTYFNERKSYQVKRVDADEVLFIRPWDGSRLVRELQPYEDRIKNPHFEILLENEPSLFANGRQVCMLSLKGDVV